MPGPKPRDPKERFWEKVNKDGPTQPHMRTKCWEWTAAKDKDGYPLFQLSQKKTVRGTRWLWEITKGEIPDGMKVCHKCDNPSCVRPLHFFLGSSKRNNGDRNKKGRQAKGEKVGNARLTEDDVRKIRVLAGQGMPQRKIAKQFGVAAHSTIGFIISGKTWGHVK